MKRKSMQNVYEAKGNISGNATVKYKCLPIFDQEYRLSTTVMASEISV